MNALSFVRPDQRPEEAGEKQDAPFFLAPILWQLSYTRQLIDHFMRIERAATLDAKNQIQMSAANQMFPGDDARQSECLLSEICRERFSRMFRENPWFVSWHQAGLRDFVVQESLRIICHHRECHLCASCSE